MHWSIKTIFLLVVAAAASAAAADDSAPALLAAGRVDEAIVTLRGRIGAMPNDAAAHNLLCRAYFSIGDWNRSVSACEQAVSLDPQNSRYHLWLGRVYGEKADSSSFFTAAGLAKKVRTEFEQAVQLDPDNVDARTDLAEFYLEAPGIVGGGQDKARAQLQTLAKLDPAKAHWVKGRLAEKRKDPVEAEKEYRAALSSEPGNAAAHRGLAEIERRQGKMEEAVKDLQASLEARDSAVVRTILAKIYLEQKKPELARAEVERALKLAPNYEEAKQLLEHLQNAKPARRSLEVRYEEAGWWGAALL